MGEHKVNPFARNTTVQRPTVVRDRFATPINPGDLVMLHANEPLFHLVQAVVPMLDPKVPPNHVRVTLINHVNLIIPAGEMNSMLTMIRPEAVKGMEGAQAPAEGKGTEEVLISSPAGAAGEAGEAGGPRIITEG